MPLIVEQRDWPAWLGEVEADLAGLLSPSPAGTLRVWPVARAVNSSNSSAELLDPI